MSNQHYENSSQSSSMYASLQGSVTQGSDSSLPSCLDRGNKDRSVKDRMYFDYFVLGKPMNLKPMHSNVPGNNNLCGK